MEPGDARSGLTQLRRGVLENLVLALLRDRPRYAVDLVRELTRAGELLTSEGTIYPLLSRMRREGLLDSAWQESPAGPPRRYYSLTGPGRSSLSAFLTDWKNFRDSVDAVLSTPTGRR